MSFIGRWQKRSCRETILKDAAGIYPIGIDQFDSDPFLFNCLNGTLNIRTGEFYAHRSEDLLSKLAGVRYDSHAQSKRWEDFISKVMQYV
jgi:putative DNA primase/helicase